MLGNGRRVGRFTRGEPSRHDEVRTRALLGGEHRVGRVTHVRVAKRVRSNRVAAPRRDQQLLGRESLERHLHRVAAAEQHGDTFSGK